MLGVDKSIIWPGAYKAKRRKGNFAGFELNKVGHNPFNPKQQMVNITAIRGISLIQIMGGDSKLINRHREADRWKNGPSKSLLSGEGGGQS